MYLQQLPANVEDWVVRICSERSWFEKMVAQNGGNSSHFKEPWYIDQHRNQGNYSNVDGKLVTSRLRQKSSQLIRSKNVSLHNQGFFTCRLRMLSTDGIAALIVLPDDGGIPLGHSSLIQQGSQEDSLLAAGR